MRRRRDRRQRQRGDLPQPLPLPGDDNGAVLFVHLRRRNGRVRSDDFNVVDVPQQIFRDEAARAVARLRWQHMNVRGGQDGEKRQAGAINDFRADGGTGKSGQKEDFAHGDSG